MSSLRRVLNDPDRCQDVISHRLVFCDYAQSLPMEELALECECCGRFLAFCCPCTMRSLHRPPSKPCHYYKMAYVDGACLNNGRGDATSGIGIAIGANSMSMHWAIPVDDDMDPCFARTSQRAELLAAIQGIHTLAASENVENTMLDFDETPKSEKHRRDKITWVITSDSEYVVLGMTEWVPAWKRNGWRNASGRRPKNVDLFQRLDAAIEQHEQEYGVQIAFWRISREYNELADELAKFAAKGHTVEPIPLEPMYALSDDDDDEMVFEF